MKILNNKKSNEIATQQMQTDKLLILPNPKDNIYPWNQENIDALLNFYFRTKELFNDGGDLSFLYKNSHRLTLNQLEFIAQKIIENLPFFKKERNYGGLDIRNLMNYGIDAFFEDFRLFDVSWNRNRITMAFFELLTKNRK